MESELKDEGHDDPEARTTAFGMWRYSLEYLTAACLLGKAEAESGKDPDLHWDVTYQCACQGLELAFKGYIRATGATLNELKKIGHSINRASERAFELGLRRLTIDQLAAIDIADRLYANHEFRYIQTGMKTYPRLASLIGAGAAALLNAAPNIARSTSGNDQLLPRMQRDASRLSEF